MGERVSRQDITRWERQEDDQKRDVSRDERVIGDMVREGDRDRGQGQGRTGE